MNRDKSPKRKARLPELPVYAVFDLVKNYCDFLTLVRLYLSSKSLWPLFNNLSVQLRPYRGKEFISTLEVWQELLECKRYLGVFCGRPYYPDPTLLSIISVALRGNPVTNITQLFGIEVCDKELYFAATLNGTKAFFNSYLKRRESFSEGDLRVILDDLPPLLSGELNAHYKHRKSQYWLNLDRQLDYLEASLTYRLIHGIVHFNAILRRCIYNLLKNWVSLRQRYIRCRRKTHRARAEQLILLCREWGHPKALRLITTFLEPMAAPLATSTT